MNYELKVPWPVKRVYRSNLRNEISRRRSQIKILIFVCKIEPPSSGKFRSICMKKQKYDFSFLSEPEPLKFNRQHLLLGIFTS